MPGDDSINGAAAAAYYIHRGIGFGARVSLSGSFGRIDDGWRGEIFPYYRLSAYSMYMDFEKFSRESCIMLPGDRSWRCTTVLS